MGKATRWLKGIFGIKNNTNTNTNTSNSGDRKRQSFGKSRNADSGAGAANVTSSESAWLKSYYDDSEKEQSKHAIAVAAATAAAADAAVAAAQAAVAVVRLTSHGRGGMNVGGSGGGGGGGGRVKWAAVKIQTTFRGYLARKALRALKGLVKIQALVRGYLVRKQATATLHGMQALIRAQNTVRSKRAQAQAQAHISSHTNYAYSQQDFRPRRSMEMFDENRSEQSGSVHSRRLSASFESRTINPIIEDIPKIVEVDPGRPRSSRSWRNNSSNFSGTRSEYGDQDPCYPPRLSIPSFHEPEWGLTGDECRFSTSHSTPRFGSNPSLGPITPSKSVCGENGYYYFRHNTNNNGDHQHYPYGHHPNYMSNTQSFRAKVRSLSAPKQRPEPGSKKKLSLNEMMESRSSLSGVKMQRTCSQAQEAINFKNAIMGKLHERSYEFVREQHS